MEFVEPIFRDWPKSFSAGISAQNMPPQKAEWDIKLGLKRKGLVSRRFAGRGRRTAMNPIVILFVFSILKRSICDGIVTGSGSHGGVVSIMIRTWRSRLRRVGSGRLRSGCTGFA